MDLIIPVSWGETASGALLPANANAAYAALREQGCAILRGVFSTSDIDTLHREYVSQFGELNAAQMRERTKAMPTPFVEVGEGRFEITPRMKGAFAAPKLLANDLLRRFLAPLLGKDMRLSGFTIVVSHPGAALQHVHRDHAYLYPELDAAQPAPSHAINVSIPLIDVGIETGPTGIWPGSHKWSEARIPPDTSSTQIPFKKGDCVLLDYRLLHTGLPNRSTQARPLIYMTYVRTWFFDEVNHLGRSALDMSLETFLTLPESVRPILLRVYTQAMRVRHLNEPAPAATSQNRPSS